MDSAIIATLRSDLESLIRGATIGGNGEAQSSQLDCVQCSESHSFLEKYFGLNGLGTREPGEAMSFLSDDNGMVLALFRGKNGQVSYPSGFHIGFIQESEEHVNQINQRLLEDGFKVPKPARLHGSWTFYFQSPGGFTIEVLH